MNQSNIDQSSAGYIIKNSISHSYKKPTALKNVPKFGKLNGVGRFILVTAVHKAKAS